MSDEELSFTPIEYGDVNDVPPPIDAPEGKYLATIRTAEASKSNKDGLKEGKPQWPMLVLEFEIDEAEKEEGKEAIGNTTRDYIVLMPVTEGKSSRMGREKMRLLLAATGIDPESFPKEINPETLKEVAEAVQDSQISIWITNQKDRYLGELRSSVHYEDPKKRGAKVGSTKQKPQFAKVNGTAAPAASAAPAAAASNVTSISDAKPPAQQTLAQTEPATGTKKKLKAR